jgi:serine/threonine protein kinase
MLQDGQEILEGRFQIVKKLGSGAFGEIYKGKQQDRGAAWARTTRHLPPERLSQPTYPILPR